MASFDATLRRLRRMGSIGTAGAAYAQNNFDPRFPSQSFDTARDFDEASSAATAAVNAPYGSIAQRNNPFNYGSVAGRQFSSFGDPAARQQFDELQQRGGLRRGLSRFPGDDNGY